MRNNSVRSAVSQAASLIMCFALIIAVISPIFSVNTSAAGAEAYFNYYGTNTEVATATDNITVFDSENAVEISADSKTAEWTFEVKEAAKYSVLVNYTAIKGNGNDITFALLIDGKASFRESEALTLTRIWKDELDENGEFYTDRIGNNRLPTQTEVFRAQDRWLYDVQGMYTEPYQYLLSAGEHTVTLSYVDGGFTLNKLIFGQPEELISYEDYRASVTDNGNEPTKTIRIEAASSYEKSDSSLYPQTDKSNASTIPNEPGITLFNNIGGSNWSYTGDSISWKTDVKEEGWYKVVIKARQNSNQGMNSYRNLKIDGEVKFAGTDLIVFPYNLKWDVYPVGGDEPYLIYFTEGEHILTMECVAGPMSEPLRELNSALSELNSVYRDIVMVTGASPDVYQDYNLDVAIPDLMDNLKQIQSDIDSIADQIGAIVSTKDTQASVLDEMSIMLGKMMKSPYTIPTRLSEFKSNIEGIGSLLLSLMQQPLSIDYIELVPEKAEVGSGKVGFFTSFSYNLKSFFCSFVDEYSAFDTGDTQGKTAIEVWVSSGRDQVKAISQIINDKFVAETGIPIKLSMVDTGTTLIQATLAGKGPDVALNLGMDVPVNLASRDALVDLSKYDLGTLKSEISSEAFIPFEYNGGLYGLPETQQFKMLFYRTDIFEELGLEVPKTWDEFYKVMNVLQFNNLEVGISEASSGLLAGVSGAVYTFQTFLYQMGGQMFTDDLTKTMLTTETSFKAFEATTELYTDYTLSQSYDFFNRFRTGEMAMAIELYSSYNQLKSAAPELNQLWSFAPVPGTVKEDGSIDNSVVSNITGCIMLQSAVEKGIDEDAWKFISWWVSAEAQCDYANMLESTMGLLGRYTPANQKAFDGMRWTASEAFLIKEQWKAAIGIPEVPGNYSIGRSLTSAIRATISGGSARRELTLYNKDINSEIARKREEFGLY